MEIIARQKDEHSGHGPAVVRPEVSSVTRQEVRGLGGHRRQEDQPIARRQHQPVRKGCRGRGRYDLAFTHERIQAPKLIVPRKIAPRLVHRVRGCEQGRVSTTPQDEET